jgi:hypothetical protein
VNPVTNPRSALLFLALLLCANATAQGEEAAGVHFEHGDWEVACDNTLTCRIAGYHDWDIAYARGMDCWASRGRPGACRWEAPDDGLGAVLITRAAGPDALLEGKVTLSDRDDADTNYPSPKVMALWIDGKSEGVLEKTDKGDFLLTAAQIHALLAAARKDRVVEFLGDTKSFRLSGRGVSAVLLKADKAQGRVGTPGALIRKGNRPEQSVFRPRPVPVIRAAKVSGAPSRILAAPEAAALKPLLWQNKTVQKKCDASNNEFTLTPLTKDHVLISTLCWRGRDASSDGGDVDWVAYWVADSALENSPKLVTHRGSGYNHDGGNGWIHRRFRVVKLGKLGDWDCWEGASWIWDGKTFRLSGKWTTGKCRYIHPGGTWRLPTFVADVINADGTLRASPGRIP